MLGALSSIHAFHEPIMLIQPLPQHRFVLVLDGKISVTPASGGKAVELGHNDYVYFPPGDKSKLVSGQGAGILVWERVYSLKGSPVFFHGHVEDSALLPTAGEVFELRKLLPQVCWRL
jgi:(S)-ureidoglycine aminohydrolase